MSMQNGGSRIILLGRDLELRIISLIVRAREISQEVVFFDLGSNDMTVELAEEFDCRVFHYNSELGCFKADELINIHQEWPLLRLDPPADPLAHGHHPTTYRRVEPPDSQHEPCPRSGTPRP